MKKIHCFDQTNKEEINTLGFYEFVENQESSAFNKYQDLVIGKRKYGYLIKYELLTFLLTNLPGIIGLFLRQKIYKVIIKRMGSGVVIGMGVTLKQPNKMTIGKGTIIDDFVSLSVRGSQDSAINISNHVFVGRSSILNARDGVIEIGAFTSIGSNCRIATPHGKLNIGRYVLIAANCYIGGGNHKINRTDIPIAKQGFESKGGVVIEDDVWIGANTVIADGVRIGRGSVIGACSYVNKDIPEYSISFGIPASVRKQRK